MIEKKFKVITEITIFFAIFPSISQVFMYILSTYVSAPCVIGERMILIGCDSVAPSSRKPVSFTLSLYRWSDYIDCLTNNEPISCLIKINKKKMLDQSIKIHNNYLFSSISTILKFFRNDINDFSI